MNKTLWTILVVAVSATCITALVHNDHYESIHRSVFESDSVSEEGSSAESEENGRCDGRRLQRCSIRHNRHYGIRKRRVTFKEYLGAFFKLLTTQGGRRGWTNVCRWGREFAECAGPEVLRNCYTVEKLESFGLSEKEAYGLLAFQREMMYECTTGFPVIANDRNFACMVRAGKGQQAKFVGCVKTFVQQVKKSPCKAAQSIVNCFGGVMRSACGAAVGNNECNVLKAALSVKFSKCRTTCNAAANPLINYETETSEDDELFSEEE